MPTDPNMESKPVKNVVTKEKHPLHTDKKIDTTPFEKNIHNKKNRP